MPRAENGCATAVRSDMLDLAPRAEADGPLVASPRLGAWSGDVAIAALVGTIGVTPFKRLRPRHIPALGCFTHDPQGAPP